MMSTTMRRVALSTLLVLPLLASVPAAAQPAPRPRAATDSAAAGDEADALFKRGMAALTSGNTQQAYELDLAAWKLKKTHDIAGNLAQVELMLGKKRDAAEHITFALANFPPTVPSERRASMKKVLDGLRKELGVLRIQVSVADAKVAVDGMPIDAASLAGEVFVDPGSHVIEATLKGYKPARAPFDAAKGSTQDLALTLEALPDTPPPGGGTPEPGGVRKPVIITGAVLGGAGVVLGAVFLGVSAAKGSAKTSLSEKVRAEGGCATATAGGSCAELRSAGSARAAFGNAGLWTLVGGGVVGAATVIYAIVGAPKAAPPKNGWRVLPVMTAEGGGLLVKGSF
jgi:hypothetical protein